MKASPVRRSTALLIVALGVLGLLLPQVVQAGRFIATPTAQTLPEGKYSIWQFALYETESTKSWRSLNRFDIGLTDDTELGVFVISPSHAPTKTWINLQHRIVGETPGRPVVSVGVWDATNIHKFSGGGASGSFFVAAGKTLHPSVGNWSPPFLKVTLAAGTNRLNGIFGGLELRAVKDTGLHIEYAPSNLRMPGTTSIDAGVYRWLSPNWRVRASSVGGNPMFDVVFTGQFGK